MELYLIGAIAVALLWLTFSPDAFADSVRVRFFHVKSVLARKLDSAVARQELAAANADLAKSKAETALLNMKTARNELARQLAPFDKTIADMDAAAKRAAADNRSDLVAAAVTKMQEAQTDSAGIRTQHTAACARVESLTHEIDTLDTEIKRRRANVADAKSRSADSTSRKDIYEIIAGLDSAGSQANQQKAEDLLVHAEAEADTYQEQAKQVTDARRQTTELAAMAKPDYVSPEDLVAKYMAEHGTTK